MRKPLPGRTRAPSGTVDAGSAGVRRETIQGAGADCNHVDALPGTSRRKPCSGDPTAWLRRARRRTGRPDKAARLEDLALRVVQQRHYSADAERPDSRSTSACSGTTPRRPRQYGHGARAVGAAPTNQLRALASVRPDRPGQTGGARSACRPRRRPYQARAGASARIVMLAWMARSSACCSAVSSWRRFISFSVASRRRRRMTSWPCTALMADSTLVLAALLQKGGALAEAKALHGEALAKRLVDSLELQGAGVQGRLQTLDLPPVTCQFGCPFLQITSSLVEGLVQCRLQSFEPGGPTPAGENVVDRGNQCSRVLQGRSHRRSRRRKRWPGSLRRPRPHGGCRAPRPVPSSAAVRPRHLAPPTAAAKSTGLATRSGSLAPVGVASPVFGLVTAFLGLSPPCLQDRLAPRVLGESGPGASLTISAGRSPPAARAS